MSAHGGMFIVQRPFHISWENNKVGDVLEDTPGYHVNLCLSYINETG